MFSFLLCLGDFHCPVLKNNDPFVVGGLVLLANGVNNYRLAILSVCRQSLLVIHSHGREQAS